MQVHDLIMELGEGQGAGQQPKDADHPVHPFFPSMPTNPFAQLQPDPQLLLQSLKDTWTNPALLPDKQSMLKVQEIGQANAYATLVTPAVLAEAGITPNLGFSPTSTDANFHLMMENASLAAELTALGQPRKSTHHQSGLTALQLSSLLHTVFTTNKTLGPFSQPDLVRTMAIHAVLLVLLHAVRNRLLNYQQMLGLIANVAFLQTVLPMIVATGPSRHSSSNTPTSPVLIPGSPPR